MSSEEQAEAYFEEARLTLESARAIHGAAGETEDMWAQVVKNAYDAIEQAISGAIAASDESIPRDHPAKVGKFIDLYDLEEDIEKTLLHWLRRRSDSQYVDIRGDEINIPHELFDRDDAEAVIRDAAVVMGRVERILGTR